MESEPKTPWYRNGGFVAGAVVTGLMAIGLIGAVAEPSVAPSSARPAAAAAAVAAPSQSDSRYVPVSERVHTQPATETVPLPNDSYYTNVDGEQVHSPAYAPSEPRGASARCRDGTYSFSRNRRGTCSHHGGVEEWL